MAPPNILFFHVDNLGFGELGCYGGGVLRGAETKRIDAFAREGFLLLNYAPEAQCTPSRSALMTGRYAIRSGNHTVPLPGYSDSYGIVAWEKTIADMLSPNGYRTMAMGKWHVGEGEGRWPTDHGFDEWYGTPHSWDEALWPSDPFYVKGRDPESYMLDATRGAPPRRAEDLTYELKLELDTEFKRRTFRFMDQAAAAGQPFYVYFNPTLMHLPNAPRQDFRGKSGNGDWADCLLQLDHDFGALLDHIDGLGLKDNTIVVLAGDNGNEEMLLHRGSSGFWDGSYFTGTEASLRTPCIARWPGHIVAGAQSNDIMHCADWFTTLLAMAGVAAPEDRVIDSIDQTAWLTGQQPGSNREGFLFWNGDTLYGIKWRNFKMIRVLQRYMTDPALTLPTPHVINLLTDPKEREPFNPVHLHSWTFAHFGRLFAEFQASVQREGIIPAGAPLDYVPKSGQMARAFLAGMRD